MPTSIAAFTFPTLQAPLFLSLAESLFSALNVRSPGLWTAFADETEVGNKLAIAAGGVNVRKGRTKKGDDTSKNAKHNISHPEAKSRN